MTGPRWVNESGGFCHRCPDHEACLQGGCHLMGGPVKPEDNYQKDPANDEDWADNENYLGSATELIDWWTCLAASDANAVIPKAVEYGGADFDIMGAAMLGLKPELWDGADAGERLAQGREMAIMFYALGKVARAMSAYGEGRKPSDDTLADLARYAMMARRVRETGKWV